MSLQKQAQLINFWEKSTNLPNFKRHLFRYLILREGISNAVYKDSKGIPTVGIGHRVVPADRLVMGQSISDAAIMSFFENDFSRLQIEDFTQPFWFRVPNKVAVGSFIWTHGSGGTTGKGYRGGQTQRLAESIYTTPDQLQTWLNNNWDLASPVNKVRNEADFQLWRKYQASDTGGYHQSLAGSGNWFYNDYTQDSYYSRSDMVKAYNGGGNDAGTTIIGDNDNSGNGWVLGTSGIVVLVVAGLMALLFKK